MKIKIKTPFDIKRCDPAVANEKSEEGHSNGIAGIASCLRRNIAKKVFYDEHRPEVREVLRKFCNKSY